MKKDNNIQLEIYKLLLKEECGLSDYEISNIEEYVKRLQENGCPVCKELKELIDI